MIDVTLPEGVLTSDQRDALAERLSATLLHWEGGDRFPFARQITNVYFDERPAGSIYVGGEPAPDNRYRLLVTIPEGAMPDDQRKAGLVDAITRDVLEVEGGDVEEDALRVWVFIHEVPDGHWGGAGRIFRLRDIVKMAASDGEVLPDRPTVAA
jgi:phenylpyruvate tautomerase PptA (4-oxalocrotonate tautomerase family)